MLKSTALKGTIFYPWNHALSSLRRKIPYSTVKFSNLEQKNLQNLMKIEKGSLNARTFYLPPFFTYQDKAAAQESLMWSMLKDKTIKKERKGRAKKSLSIPAFSDTSNYGSSSCFSCVCELKYHQSDGFFFSSLDSRIPFHTRFSRGTLSNDNNSIIVLINFEESATCSLTSTTYLGTLFTGQESSVNILWEIKKKPRKKNRTFSGFILLVSWLIDFGGHFHSPSSLP